jgi:ABC-type polysaccharide/polyol phosphate transport system ATPase subunit
MPKTIISVEHLTKRYDLGVINTGTLSRDINRWWALLRGKSDPYFQIGQPDHGNRTRDSILALDDVSFQVQQGEALGIIGHNGAGKSTLLKILSRITAPTSGKVKMNGRVGSLLEVGTGFHPELTGRENIYLNGAILGMSHKDVERKFDEIVDFSGVEQFIDTPVKHFSSGMYVRLAFAVAAHLEPEILIVDEVLAVGDIEFQKKCLGKMGDVAHEGRTVLFVSHNMAAISKLSNNGIVLDKGSIISKDTIENSIKIYLDLEKSKDNATIMLPPSTYQNPPGTGKQLTISDTNDELKTKFFINEKIKIEFFFEMFEYTTQVIASVAIQTVDNITIITYWSIPKDLEAGTYKATFLFDLPLSSMGIQFSIGLATNERPFYYNSNIGYINISEIAQGKQPLRASGTGIFVGEQIDAEITRVHMKD